MFPAALADGHRNQWITAHLLTDEGTFETQSGKRFSHRCFFCVPQGAHAARRLEIGFVQRVRSSAFCGGWSR